MVEDVAFACFGFADYADDGDGGVAEGAQELLGLGRDEVGVEGVIGEQRGGCCRRGWLHWLLSLLLIII